MVLLAIGLAALGGGALSHSMRVGEDGFLRISLPGKKPIVGRLFTWYGDWTWRSPEWRRGEDGAWRAVISKKKGDGPGEIVVARSLRRRPSGLAVRYEFQRRGSMALRRGVFLSLSLPYPDFEGRTVVGSHGRPALTDRGTRFASRGCTVNLTERVGLEVRPDRATVFGIRAEEGHGSLNVRLLPADFGQEGAAEVTLRLTEPAEPHTAWNPASEQPLALRGVSADHEDVARYERVEFTLDASAAYQNPFDPEQVAVEAAFTTPSGRSETVPGFYYQGFQVEREEGLGLLAPSGEPGWKVRYTPREEGQYSAVFRIRDRSGEESFGPVGFRCVGSERPGFVRIGPGPGPRYFRLDNGETLFLIGHNVTTYAPNLEEVFGRMAEGGENYTRFWMWSRGLGLEWGLPVGRYRLEEAWRLDRTLQLARRHGLWLMLCFDTHQDFREKWEENPYNARNGGPCREVTDFFTDARARSLYRARLRYVMARWGYHPRVLAWEFVNEIEGWRGALERVARTADWHEEMAAHLADLDPYDHPVTTSMWTTQGVSELWNVPGLDFIQSHYYANRPNADMAGDVAFICRQKRDEYPDELHVFGEYGILARSGTARRDPIGVHLHNGNWAALMGGCASNPVSWWHGSYIHPLDLYGIYRGLADFVAGEPLSDLTWHPLEVESVQYLEPLEEVSCRDLEFGAPRSGWEAPMPEGTRFVPRRNGEVENLELLPRVIHGRAHPELRAPLVFELDCRTDTRFGVRVGEVSAGGILEVRVDGEPVRSVELPAGEGLGRESTWREEWDIWQTLYDRWHYFEVPEGHHTVELVNRGRDWIELRRFRIEDYATNEEPPLRVLGQASPSRVLLWVQNKGHTWFRVREGARIPPVRPVQVKLAGLEGGRWRVELWDTRCGRVTKTSTATAQDGTLTLEVPQVEKDLAVKLSR